MSTLGRGIRRSGILQRLQSPEQIQHQQALVRFIDPITGQITDPKALAPYLPLVGGEWGEWQRVRQPSVLLLLAVRATTAPSSGDALISLQQDTEASGVETLVTLRIPEGQRFASVTPMVPILAGAWLGYALTTTAGASGISVSYSLKVG
jgi:hypothetical protein